MSKRFNRKSAHLKSYKDAEADLSQDEDDDGDFNILTVQKSIDVDDDTHAANINQLNFEKNDFDQLMYNESLETNDVNSSTEQCEPLSQTPPRPSVKSRLGVRPTKRVGNRGKQSQQKAIQKRGKTYPYNINGRNNSMENYNQNRVSANFHRGLEAYNKFRERNESFGESQNVLNIPNSHVHIENLGPNGPIFNGRSNTDNFNLNSNFMMRSNHMNTSDSNSFGGLLPNNQGPVNSNSRVGMFSNNQGSANSNRIECMLQNNQEHVNSNGYDGLLSNNPVPVNSNGYGGLLSNNPGPVNSKGYGGLFSNNPGPVNSKGYGGLFSNNQVAVNSNGHGGLLSNNQVVVNSNGHGGLLSNNMNSYDGIGLNHPNTSRRDIIANNWNSSIEMNSTKRIPPNNFLLVNRQELLVDGSSSLSVGPARPARGMFIGEALGMTLSDCKTVDVHQVTQNVLSLLSNAEKDSESKTNYGVHNKSTSQQRDS
ncbi:probable cyclin-dependent serine/threonine-protein kinase DDB_G0292550 isoform X1 [Drosophila miranda]|uniref:probable cyclin-dependent serine/threonine-protein kinase DDB_G0292550 isoform X1 n=1 Tax=Drosophila miranda TaxID=7229 RepID=UPI00143F644B|nr:probable cyclin-dependent serine/threonine-protein kinase DDB_G0292550 isoform X1 [Drosophila miranda]